MATQNLISASIAAEAKTDILQKLTDISGKLDFLLTLQPTEVKSLFKVGNGYLPFLERTYRVAVEHPQILPAVFDFAEFQKDYQLAGDLADIAHQVQQLHTALQNTMTAAYSDAIAEALEVYGAVKLNSDRVAGLNAVAVELGTFFKRPRKSAQPNVADAA